MYPSEQHCMDFRWMQTSSNIADGAVHSMGSIYLVCIVCRLSAVNLPLYCPHHKANVELLLTNGTV